MAAWAAFAGFVAFVLTGLLALAFASTSAFDASPSGSDDVPPTLTDRVVGGTSERPRRGRHPAPTAAVFWNVVLSQGVFASVLVIGTWYAAVPAAALGATRDALTPSALGAGLALGLGLGAVNAVGGRLSDRLDFGDSGALRRAMTPASTAGWVALLLVVLPLVAGFEELLFRGILVGAFAAGFDVSPWLLAAGSSVLFALGHGAQGRAGVAVTGLLGFVLAAAFVLTGSLLTVVVAHYLVNVLEFLANGT